MRASRPPASSRIASRTEAWRLYEPNRRATLRLFCVPYAGGSASVYREWVRSLPAHVEVYGIQLPGRSNRYSEPLLTEVPAVVDGVGGSIAPLLDRPFAFFGHSLGALLAFELTRWTRRRLGRLPEHLIVSGRRAPHLPPTPPLTYQRPDDELIAELAELCGTPMEILGNAELMAMMLPTVRADFQLSETYEYVPDVPLSCPMTVLGGSEDEESEEDRLPAWQRHTTGPFDVHVFDGGHFFIQSQETEVLALLRGLLEPLGRRDSAPTA